MSLTRGARIGSYDIVEPIGAGGMGATASRTVGIVGALWSKGAGRDVSHSFNAACQFCHTVNGA